MSTQIIPAIHEDMQPAELLTRQNMAEYYARHGMVWSRALFYRDWAAQERYRIHHQQQLAGFIRFTADDDRLTIRDFQLYAAYRKKGIGSRVIELMGLLASLRGLQSLRLSVFKDNPARELYQRQGFRPIKEEGIILQMEKLLES